MNINIIQYSSKYYPTLDTWSKESGEPFPPKEYLPESTFILEKNNLPVFTGSLILTNTPVCYFEYFASDPSYKEIDRHELAQCLFDFLTAIASGKGYKKLAFYSYRDKLKKRYEELGAIKTLDGISSFVKELE